MARIEIDTGVATTTTVKAAFDDINTMTTELYQRTYQGHNAVAFNGVDRLTHTNLGLGSAIPGALFATKFRLPQLPDADWYFWNNGKGSAAGVSTYGSLCVTPSGEVTVALAAAGAATVVGTTVGAGLVAGMDYTVHASIDGSARAASDETLAYVTGSTVTFTVPYISGVTTVTRASVPQTEGTHFTVSQYSPAILNFGTPLSVGETVELSTPSDRLHIWINGVEQNFTYVTDDAGSTWNMSTTAANRAVLGARHNAVGTPTYATDSYLGYDSTKNVNVLVFFFLFNPAPNNNPATTSRFGKDIDLSAFESAGATPALVFFGGEQVAADWNAGENLGTLGGFTVTGPVV